VSGCVLVCVRLCVGVCCIIEIRLMSVWHDTFAATSSLLQGFFAEYRLFYRALLQKRLIILRSLLVIATLMSVWHDTLAASWFTAWDLQNIVSFIGLFCKRALQKRILQKRRYSALESVNHVLRYGHSQKSALVKKKKIATQHFQWPFISYLSSLSENVAIYDSNSMCGWFSSAFSALHLPSTIHLIFVVTFQEFVLCSCNSSHFMSNKFSNIYICMSLIYVEHILKYIHMYEFNLRRTHSQICIVRILKFSNWIVTTSALSWLSRMFSEILFAF